MPARPQPVPEGTHTVTPRLVCSDAAAAIEFYKRAFDARETQPRFAEPSGRIVNAEILIGDSLVRLTDDSGDGNGIAPDHLPYVFDRFYRADPSRDRATGGAGLGLAIVRSITQAHSGTVSATARPGGGLLVEVTLPMDTDP